VGATPSISSPTILTSAFPYVYSNESFAYVLQSSEAANWSCPKCPYASLLVVNPSFYASLSSSGVPFNGSQTFSVKAQMGSTTVYQNWTPTTLKSPTISSLPSFTANIGTFYDYVPTIVNPGIGGTWSFSGAPYLTLNSGTGAVSGTPLNNTAYTNVLTYSSSLGSWAQAWVTVPSTGTFPGTLTFSGTTLGHPATATLPTTAVAGLGGGFIWLGTEPLINLGSGTDGYSFSYLAPWAYTLNWLSGSTTNKDLFFYGAPGTTPSLTVDGYSVSTGAFKGWGYNNTTLTPPPKVTALSVTPVAQLSLTVAWANPAPAIADNLYYGTTCGTWLGQENLSLVTGYNIQSLAPSTSYCVGVGAVSLAGQGPLAYDNATTLTLPPATDLVGNVYGSFVALTWSLPSSVTYTNSVVYFGSSCGTWTQTFQVRPPVDDLNVSQLAGSYCVAVALFVNSYTSALVFTNVTVAPIHPPAAPMGVAVTGITSSNFTARWNATIRATSYEVLYGSVCGAYPYRVLAGGRLYANITNLSPITTYCFVVQAFNGTNGGLYSSSVSITTLSTPKNGTTNGTTPPPNPNPNPTPAPIVSVIDFFWAGVIVVGAVILSLFVAWFNRRRRK